MFGFAYPPLEDLDDLADPAFNYMTSLDNLSGSRGGGHCLSGTRYSAGVAEPATTKGSLSGAGKGCEDVTGHGASCRVAMQVVGLWVGTSKASVQKPTLPPPA